jgi:hypothetical protein
MARWMLVCPHCYHRFEYSKVDPRIVEQARRDPFKAVPKPRLMNGETKKCPGCGKASLYRGFDLFYFRDETVLVAAAASD